jgi:hypothetical protein
VPKLQKIAYALICYDAANSGVYKKIFDQINAWKIAGHLVQIFVITDKKSKALWQKIDPSAITLIDSNFFVKLLNRARILRSASKSRPSLIYLRDSFPIFLPKSSAPIVIEIQSLVGQELKLRGRFKYRMFRILKQAIYARVSAAVYVTNELMNKNEFKLGIQVPKITIGNGIDLGNVEQLPHRIKGKPALFFVGSPNQPWHGIEQLIEFGISNPDIDIHIVGELAEASQPNLYFYGNLRRESYKAIATKCIAGVGTLNLALKNMEEASPLKVREYLALGLPVISRYKDTDLDASEDYILELPSDSRPLTDLSKEIRAFLDEWAEKRVPREQIQHLDVRTKEKIRIGFFEEILTLAEGRNNQESKSESKN